MANKRSKPGPVSGDILAALRSSDPSGAWKQFLEMYSQVIMLIAGRYQHGRDRRNDCYLYVCEKLSDRNFRRLQQYRPEGSASFRSWLNVVIANLCIDWRRHERGRLRPFKAISTLPEFDQRVFEYRIQKCMSLNACLAAMQPQFPGLTESKLMSAVNRINSMLTSRQRFLLSSQQGETVSLERAGPAGEPADTAPGPERAARLSQRQQRVQRALDELPPRQRLLLKLRYEQELSLKQVARLMRLGDPFRARREIQSALDHLGRLLGH